MGRGANYCCVKGCLKNSKTSPHLSFFFIPKNEERWRTWITDIGRKDLLKKRSCYKYRVCSTHFPDAMLKNKRLKPDAVPCINLPGMTSSPTSPISSTNENMDELVDKSAMIKTEQDCEEIQMKQSENSEEEDNDSKMHIKEELIEQQQVQPQTWQIAPRSEQLYLQVGPIIQQPIRSRVDYDAHAGPSNHQPSNIKIETEDIEVFTNQFDIFGRYIALQLKSLHEADAALAQMEIQKVLTRYRNSFNNNSDENDECAFPMHSDNIPSELILKVEPELDTVLQ